MYTWQKIITQQEARVLCFATSSQSALLNASCEKSCLHCNRVAAVIFVRENGGGLKRRRIGDDYRGHDKLLGLVFFIAVTTTCFPPPPPPPPSPRRQSKLRKPSM